DSIRLIRVRHVFLYAEVVNRSIEVKRSSHRDGRQVRGAVKSCANVVEFREIRSLLEVSYTAAMDQRHPQIVDPLVADEIVRVPDRIEDLAHCNGRGCVLTDNPKAFLQLGGRRIFHPKEMEWLQFLS